MADHVGVIRQGRLVFQGTMSGLHGMSAARLALRTQDNARARSLLPAARSEGEWLLLDAMSDSEAAPGQPETDRGGHRACADGAARNEPRGHLPQTHGNGGNAMRLWLSVEWRKTPAQAAVAAVASLVAMQGLWLAWAVRGMDAAEAAQGYLGCLYQLPMMNAIVMPVAAAVLVCRLCDMEHRGDAFKQLFTMQAGARPVCTQSSCWAARGCWRRSWDSWRPSAWWARGKVSPMP